MKSKKGFSISQVPTLGVTLGVIAIIIGLMVTILLQVQTTQCRYGFSQVSGDCLNSTGTVPVGTFNDGTSIASNITRLGVSSEQSFAGWQGTWVVIIAASVVIGIVSAYLMFKGGGGE